MTNENRIFKNLFLNFNKKCFTVNSNTFKIHEQLPETRTRVTFSVYLSIHNRNNQHAIEKRLDATPPTTKFLFVSEQAGVLLGD
jgi:hypothetical protein